MVPNFSPNILISSAIIDFWFDSFWTSSFAAVNFKFKSSSSPRDFKFSSNSRLKMKLADSYEIFEKILKFRIYIFNCAASSFASRWRFFSSKVRSNSISFCFRSLLSSTILKWRVGNRKIPGSNLAKNNFFVFIFKHFKETRIKLKKSVLICTTSYTKKRATVRRNALIEIYICVYTQYEI